MTRNDIITALSRYFKPQELVCDHVFQRWGEQSWQFLDTDYLECLLIIRRDILRRPMFCNGGNCCEIVKQKSRAYLSAHVLGKAGDFTVCEMPAAEARQMIKRNQNLLPCNIRLEADVSWLHFDVLPQRGVTTKVYEFKV